MNINEDVKNFINSLKESLNFIDNHETNLKYLYNNNKDKFFEQLKFLIFSSSFFDSYDSTLNKLTKPITISSYNYCFKCGNYVKYEIGNNYIKSIDDCFNLNEYSFNIKVPSGKMIFCDWPDFGKDVFYPLENNFEKGHDDINCSKGKYLTSKGYSQYNIANFFVGNTDPHILQKNNVIYVQDENYNKDNSFKDYGSICTDLWWVTAFDILVYKNLLNDDEKFKDFLQEIKNNYYVVLDIAPGIYKCTYNNKLFVDVENNGNRYLTIEKI